MTVLYLFLLVIIVSAQEPKPVVKLQAGLLQGTWKESTKGRQYASFLGVPYARPPVGKYRFKEPQPLKPWIGVWDATRHLSGCLRYDAFTGTIAGNENCLFLNVFTPKLQPGANLPVVVYIHGGAFMFGSSGLYDASHFMDRNIVIVTFNYRLGPLGFLSTGDDVIPGNNGLKDQSKALHWVRDNILYFGGNPDSVTLIGLSAGGASVHYHYLSPLSKDTFHRGIAFSGSAFSSWAHSVKPAQKAKALAAIVGCPTTTTREILECLKYRPAEVIVNAQIEMFDWKAHMFTPFTPTVEAPGAINPFLSVYPYHAAMRGDMHKVPLIATITSEEGLYPAAAYQADPDQLLSDLEASWEQLSANIFEYNDTLPLEQRAAVAAKIKQHYLGNQPVSQKTFAQLVQALGDRHFVADIGKLAQIHASTGQPTYVYRYSFRGSTSHSRVMAHNDNDYGVSHADDVMRMFIFPGLETTGPEDAEMIERLLDIVETYATTGIPSMNNGGPTWTPVKQGSPNIDYLEISSPTKSEMKTSSDFGQRSFWDGLGFIENERYHAYIRDEL